MKKHILASLSFLLSLTAAAQTEVLRIELNDGTVYDERVDIVYGHPRNRMEWPDLAGKFRDCASYCKRALTADEIDAIASMVEHLEDVEDMSVLMEAVR